MDHDNNDFQGHNRQLTGEGSSKLSPVLRDYALPKFDFDDGINGHLRFDSLVENDVFLGIPNQEDNQWIEDFSRGSTGIEFSSSATEPCSISRHNNVWSEAASSESVEMLLNSVGQEESVLREAIIEELDVGDEFGKLTKEMEPNVEHDNKIGDAIHSQPALLPEDFSAGRSIGASDPSVECNSEAQKDDSHLLKSFSEVNSHVEGGDKIRDAIHSKAALLPVDFSAEQNDNIGVADHSVECNSEAQNDDPHLLKIFGEVDSHVEGGDKIGDAIHSQPALLPVDFSAGQNENVGVADPSVECYSEALKDDPLLLKSLSEVDSHVEGGVIVSGKNVGSDKKYGDANQMEVDNFARESLISREELPTCSEIQIGNTCLSSHIPAFASSMELKEQESIDKSTDSRAVSVDGLLEVASEGLEKHMVGQISSAAAGETCTNNIDDLQCVPSRLESILDRSVASNVTKRSELKIMGDSDLETGEVCNNDASSSEPSMRCNEVVVRSEEADTSKQPQCYLLEDSAVIDVVDGSLYGQVIKVSTTNDTSPELDIGSIEEQEKHFGGDNEVGCLEGQNNEVDDSKGGSSFRPELEMESILEKNNLPGSYNQVDRMSTEAYVLSEIDHKIIEQDDESGIDHARDLSNLSVACSSVKVRAEYSSNQNLSDVNNAAEVLEEEFIPEGHLPLTPGETMYRNIKILSCKQVCGQSFDQDVSFHEGENAKLPVESSGMERRVHGSVHDEGSKHVDEGLSSSDKLNGVPVFSGDSASADEVTLHNLGSKSPLLGVLSKGSVENEGMIIESEKNVIMPGINNSLQVESVVERVSDDSVSDDGKASQRDQAANQEFSNTLEVCSGHLGSTVEQNDGTEAAGSEKYKDVSMKGNTEVELVEAAVAMVQSEKSVAPTEAISSIVESCCQKGHESILPSGTQNMGQIVPTSKDAMIQSDKSVAPAEAISSMVESGCQMGLETVLPSGTQIMGQMVPCVKVVLSDENQASTALAFPSECVTDIMNEDGDKSDNSVKENCESPTIFSCNALPAREKGQKDEIKQTTVDSVLQSDSTHDTGAMVKSVPLQDEKDTSKEEKSFTFEVRLSGPSDGGTHKSWQSFHNDQVHKISTSQIDPKAVPEISYVNDQVPVEVIKLESAKAQRKTRSSGKATARKNVKKENRLKETTPLRQSEKVDKAIMFKGSSGTGQIVQLEELKSSGEVEQSGAKICGVLSTLTSSLPDLNTLVPAAAFFQQPFTDLQQVQLRAQILVYGSLMQEAVPDEACMISAFGTAEDGRSIWDPAWRSCIERVRGQQSHTSNSETPAQSHSGSKGPDKPVKHSSLQNKVFSSPAARVSSKGIPSPAANPMIPLSSPLWNVSSATCDGLSRSAQDYHQPLSPVYPYQAMGVKSFSGHSPSWLSQAPFPGPWMASPQTSRFDVNTRFSMFPNTEPVKLTPATDSPAPHFPATEHGSLPAVANDVGGSRFSSGTDSQPSTQHSTKPKPRKSKKVPVTEGLCQISSPNLSQTALAYATGVGDHLSKAPAPGAVGQKPLIAQSQSSTIPTAFVSSLSSTPIAITTPACIVSTSSSGKCLASLSPASLTDEPIRMNQNLDKGVVSNETSMPYLQKATVSFSQHSTDPKPRKRKKVPVAEGPCQTSSPTLSQTASPCTLGVGNQLSKKVPAPEAVGQKSLFAESWTDTLPTAIVNNLSSTSVAVTNPAQSISTSSSGKLLAAFSPSLSEQLKRVDHNMEKRGISDETLNTVEEATRQAEIAASHAADAVGHCNDVWSQLDKQNNSGLASDVEGKLASVAMAIAAASSVAKAAAAATKIASSVAVQAKLMAEEVLVSSTTVNSILGTGNILSNVPNSSGNAAPSSILKDGDGNVYPSSIIAVAREAARKRVEAASAASKHAEILAAIVKAAELAAEAVSHAGKIVSIGDPLPLSRLVESGPGDYWKSPQGSTEKGATNTLSFDELHNVSAEQSKMGPSVMEEVVNPGTVTRFEKGSSRVQSARRASTMAKNVGVVPEAESGLRFASIIAEDPYTIGSGQLVENGMKQGCLVEVLKDGGNFKAAWYSANILNVKDGKAFVCYTELQADEGQLKEWVSFEGDVGKAPTVRMAHPTTTMRFDGTRKRRREAMMDYNWSVGDKVDAWMQDCWHEGIVREKNKNDETTLKIYFPALEDTLTVRAWHLRPTLIWQDGEWIEWSSEGRHSSQGDAHAPQGKRVKLGSPSINSKGKDKMSTGLDLVEVKQHEESRQLPLSAYEKEFNVGKSTRHGNKVDTHRTVRMGLPKEGSRVVFGVPKPGKKRKFMDVSKHFDSDRSSKNINTSNSVKFSRYLVPEGSGSRGWKTITKNEVRERPTAEDKTKVLGSGKASSALVRAQKVNLTSGKSGPHDAATKDQQPENVISNEERNTGQQNLMEFQSLSYSQDTSEGPSLESSLGLLRVASRKVLTSNTKSERLNKGKLAATTGRWNKKVEPQDKLITEAVEPRRSNRKIQPTSRLLEGLQSSLVIPKMPFVPYEKNKRSQNRSNIKGNTNHS